MVPSTKARSRAALPRLLVLACGLLWFARPLDLDFAVPLAGRAASGASQSRLAGSPQLLQAQLLARGAGAATLDEAKAGEEGDAVETVAEGDALSNVDPQKAVVRKLNDAAEFVTPSLWNRPWFRGTTLTLGGVVAGQVAPGAAVVHLVTFAAWFGANFWTTFIAGITMFKNLPRQQFGKVQAKLFPKYFQLGTICTSVMLLTGLRLGLPIAPTLVSLVATLLNLLYCEPNSTKVMFERYELQNMGEPEPKELKKKFGKYHAMSSLCNLAAFLGLVVHAGSLAARF